MIYDKLISGIGCPFVELSNLISISKIVQDSEEKNN
jgi:hypothetical protein